MRKEIVLYFIIIKMRNCQREVFQQMSWILYKRNCTDSSSFSVISKVILLILTKCSRRILRTTCAIDFCLKDIIHCWERD